MSNDKSDELRFWRSAVAAMLSRKGRKKSESFSKSEIGMDVKLEVTEAGNGWIEVKLLKEK